MSGVIVWGALRKRHCARDASSVARASLRMDFGYTFEVAEKFYLDLPLPFEIDSTKSSAKFDKNRPRSYVMLHRAGCVFIQ